MERYTLEELEKNLVDKILKLGVDSSFLENPAFSTALNNIINIINNIAPLNKDKIIVVENNSLITFEYFLGNEKVKFSLYCENPKEFKCLCDRMPTNYSIPDLNTVKTRNIIEQDTILKDNGEIVIDKNGVMLSDNKLTLDKQRDIKNCNSHTLAEKHKYSKDGIETLNLAKHYDSVFADKLTSPNVAGTLRIAHEAFNTNSSFYYDYQSSLSLERQYLDTARYILNDKKNNTKFSSMVTLNHEHSLRNMQPSQVQPISEVVISGISINEIEEMISKEKNPTIANGLRQLANGRQYFQYNSENDPNFIYDGFENLVVDSVRK